MENDDSDSKISSGSLASFYDVAVMEDTKPDEQIDETDLSPQSEDPPQTRTTWYDQSKEQPQNNLNSSPSPDSDLPPAASSEQQEFPIYSSPLPVCSQPRPEPGQTEKTAALEACSYRTCSTCTQQPVWETCSSSPSTFTTTSER